MALTQPFVEFKLERLLSAYEHDVEIDLSQSGVQPLTTRELLALQGGDVDAALAALADTGLGYPEANGSLELRRAIAAWYPGATEANVLVTVGAIQANFTSLLTVTDPGDLIAVMQPNYQQFWGLAQNLGRTMNTFSLKQHRDWALDLDELQDAVAPQTRFVAVVNPNNPTGRILHAEERARIIAGAERTGAWLLADEVYAGAERATDEFTPSFYGQYDKVLAVGSMSKAYGLPGLRIGWVVGPEEAIARMWAWQDYITICATRLGNRLAAVALSPAVRPQILARTRGYVRRGFDVVAGWAAARDDVEVLAPDAAAVCFVRYAEKVNSTELVMRLLREKSTFVAPGDLFGLDGHLRVSFGLPDEYVAEGLARIGALLDSVE
jgi:aspartate/methionine/tyrosine aminotransferase